MRLTAPTQKRLGLLSIGPRLLQNARPPPIPKFSEDLFDSATGRTSLAVKHTIVALFPNEPPGQENEGLPPIPPGLADRGRGFGPPRGQLADVA